MVYERIQTRRLTGALGAEITGVDLSQPLDAQVRAEIHHAFLAHQVVVFRGQSISPAAQVSLAALFGKPAVYPFLKGVDGYPEVSELLKTEQDPVNFGGNWHSDTAYKERPDLGTLLYALEVPEAGGDTLFANMYLAYESLSSGMRTLLDGLVAVYDSEKGYPGGRAARMRDIQGMKEAVPERVAVLEAEHPAVRTHPETGRKALYVSRSHTRRFRDMTEEESNPVIEYLADFAVRPEFTCRVRWEPGTLAIWDNRCTMHLAVNDYPGVRRRMHRVTIEGDVPA